MNGIFLLERLIKLRKSIAKLNGLQYTPMSVLPVVGTKEYDAACEREYECLMDWIDSHENAGRPLILSDDIEYEMDELMEAYEERDDEDLDEGVDLEDLDDESFDDGYDFEDRDMDEDLYDDEEDDSEIWEEDDE